jgi:hypothetical protein
MAAPGMAPEMQPFKRSLIQVVFLFYTWVEEIRGYERENRYRITAID